MVQNNIFARAAGYGLQARSGGIVENNLFIDDPVGMSFGLVNGTTSTAGGVSGIINGNVFVGGGNLNGSPLVKASSWAISRRDIRTVVSNNIFADGLPHAMAAITLTGFAQSNPQDSVGLNNLDIQGNVLNAWYRGIYFDKGFEPGGTGLRH